MASLFDAEVLRDPYPYYASLRAQGRVVWSPEMTGGSWLVPFYEDVLALLRHPALSSNRTIAYQMFTSRAAPPVRHMGEQLALYMILRDPPDHTRLRALVNRAFTPSAVAALRPRIERIATELVTAALARGEIDVISDLAFPLPATVILAMLGAPEEDRDTLPAHLDKIATFLGHIKGLKAAGAAYGHVERYIDELVARRRRESGDDLVSALIRAEEELGALHPGELTANAILLLLAGHHTTMNLIGNGLLALLTHPSELARLRSDPTQITGAVEELLRFDSPLQLATRVARERIVVGDRAIEPGEIVHVLLGSANRDPARFRDPDVLDVTRRDVKHLAFAFGPHFCVGAPLARLEAEIMFGTLLSRCARIDRVDEPLAWHANATLRGLVRLPVVIAPARSRSPGPPH